MRALSLEELSGQKDIDPMLALLTLPVRPNSELLASTQQILERRPDLLSAVLPVVVQRSKDQTEAQIMKLLGIPAKDLLHTRAVRDWFEQGRQEGEVQGEARGRALGEATVTLRLLNRRCGPLSEATTAEIQALPLEQLELLAERAQGLRLKLRWGCSSCGAGRFSAILAALAPARSAGGLSCLPQRGAPLWSSHQRHGLVQAFDASNADPDPILSRRAKRLKVMSMTSP